MRGFNMSSTPTVVFICEHGAAKSVIAAVYLRHLAAGQGTELRTLARGTDPEPSLSPIAVAGVEHDGLPVPGHNPQQPSADELATATAVVSFGPDVDDLVPEAVPRYYWRGLPAVSDGYETACSAIVTQVRDLLARLPHE
jgi:protein-tyrosine-phosphatase